MNGFCECGNEPSSSIICVGNVFDQLRNCKIFKDSAPWALTVCLYSVFGLFSVDKEGYIKPINFRSPFVTGAPVLAKSSDIALCALSLSLSLSPYPATTAAPQFHTPSQMCGVCVCVFVCVVCVCVCVCVCV